MAYFTQTADISKAGRDFVKPFISAFGTGRTFTAKVFRVEAGGTDVEVANAAPNAATISEEGAGVYSLTVPHGAMTSPNNYYAILSDSVTGEAIRVPMWTHLAVDFDDLVQLRVGDAASALNGLHGFNDTDNKATIAKALKKVLEYELGLKTEIGDMTSEVWTELGGAGEPAKPEDVAEALALIYNKEIELKADVAALDTLIGDIGAAEIGPVDAETYPETIAAALKAIYSQGGSAAEAVEGSVWDSLVADHTGENVVAGSFAALLNEAAADAEDARSAAESADGKLGTAKVVDGATVQGTVYEELDKILTDTMVIGEAAEGQEATVFAALAGIRGVVDTLTAVGQAARLSLYCPERISGFRTQDLAVLVSLVCRNELGMDDDLELVGNGRAFMRVLGQGGSPLANRLYTDSGLSTAASAGSDAAYTSYSVMTANGASNAKFSLYFKVQPKDNESFTFEATGQDSDGDVIRKVTAIKQMVVASTFAVAVGGAF